MKAKKIKTVSVKLKPTKIHSLDSILSNLIRWLDRKSIKINFLISEQSRIKKNLNGSLFKKTNFLEEKEFYSETDLLLSLGGDGTLIGASRFISKNIPIFGVNLGNLGFITEFSKTSYIEQLDKIIKGNYKTQRTYLNNVKVINKKGKTVFNSNFLNDIVINKSDIARLFSLNIECNGKHVYNLSGDGLIISSPIGSTAYSLAAGGPIVSPNVKAFIMTPICPHSLTYRPLVIQDSSKIEIRVVDRGETVSITLDGQTAQSIDHFDTIIVNKSRSKYIDIILNDERDYFQVLKEKFFHGK